MIIGTDEQTKQVLEFLKGEPFENGSVRLMDFDKIIHMPESLNIESSSIGELGEAFLYGTGRATYLLGKEEIDRRFLDLSYDQRQKYFEMGKLYHDNLQKHNARTWYDWSCKHWGTKWNAYSQKIDGENIIWFDTAWSCVLDLMKLLSSRFPDVELDYRWADEDVSYNCGFTTIKAGTDETYHPEGGSKEAYELYFELHPGRESDYIFTDGNYHYKEEE